MYFEETGRINWTGAEYLTLSDLVLVRWTVRNLLLFLYRRGQRGMIAHLLQYYDMKYLYFMFYNIY